MRQIQNSLMNESEEEAMMVECASKIADHLARNIVKYRGTPEIANRMSSMNKFIQVNYLLSDSSFRLSA